LAKKQTSKKQPKTAQKKAAARSFSKTPCPTCEQVSLKHEWGKLWSCGNCRKWFEEAQLIEAAGAGA